MKTKLLITLIFSISTLNFANAQTCNPNSPHNWSDSRYTVNADGTVLDKITRLIWKQCVEGLTASDCATGSVAKYTWKQAFEFANSHTFAGKSDWRLPNLKELASLAAFDCYNPSINETIFPNTPTYSFWSSSPNAYLSNNVWLLSFNTGYDSYDIRSNNNRLRLVRFGQ
ncbi:hypothetical protein MNB_SUP05-SYMBIONT-5-620 [hydrothermal vent metagenome]|uniref:Lcl C-terminal domain-containing protein n=1 Tax=hydrothermal vent metagenome TaxID=652676 RepID=A0A1W1E1E4_9ZZZZ